jgi:Abnormal spindle-like microcephaly-assoc'd, ASPM-SPD-2-Hydin/Protein of unknown function (DUF1573)/Fibronectin type III domain
MTDQRPQASFCAATAVKLVARAAFVCALLVWAAMTTNSAHATGTLSFSSSSASFGNVDVGSSKSIAVTIKNTGSTSVAFTWVRLVFANMYSVSGFTLPKTLTPGASFTMTVKFAPTVAETSHGIMQIGSNATNSLVNYALSGTGVRVSTPELTATPSSVSFGDAPVGSTSSQTVQLKNTGTTAVTISGATVSGTGFKLTSHSYPFNLAAGQTLDCTVSFTPTSAVSESGTVTVTSNASDRTLAVALSGTGQAAARELSPSSTSLNFGDVTVGQTHTIAVTLKNTGNTSLGVSGVTVSGTNITTSGGVSGATIAAGQSATLDVSFAPKQAETVTGKIVVSSNAADSTVTLSVAGVGVTSATSTTTSHSIALRWAPSTSASITGYYVYRATSPSTSYTRLFSAPLNATDYTDYSVTAGDTYTYEVSAVNSEGMESARSSAATAVVP